MGFFVPKSCCGCISLRAGTLIILVLSIIGSILSIFGCVYNDQYRRMYSGTALQILLIRSIIDAIITIAALLGVLSRTTGVLGFYVYYLIFELLCGIVFSVALLCIISFYNGALFCLFIIIISIIIQVYFICVINSYRDQLIKEKKEEKEIAANANLV